jgi:RNA polymerase sigma factor (sigma-70 family)
MADSGGRFEDEFKVLRREAYRTAFGVLFDAQLAEDATIDALTQTWLHWSKIADAEYRTAWVRRVALNAALRVLRKRRRVYEPQVGVGGGFEDAVAARVTLSRELLTLPRRQREAVGLRYLAALSEVEIAGALGVSVNSVKTHLRRGLAALRGRMEAGEVIGIDSAATT